MVVEKNVQITERFFDNRYKHKKYAQHKLINPQTFEQPTSFSFLRKVNIREYAFVQGGLISPQFHIDQAELGGIANQLNGAVKVQLVHNVSAVIFNGFRTDEKFLGDFF